MKIQHIDIKKIQYIKKPYDTTLYDSIVRVGLNFPIIIQIVDDTYICLDGHKRLSVIHDLIQNQVRNFTTIPAVLRFARSQSPDYLRNHH